MSPWSGWSGGAARIGAPRCPLGINIGVNKDSADPARDYADGLTRVAALADYVAVNVSSPNTPGLRAWQTGDALDRLLAALADAHARLDAPPPILLKLAPEIDDEAWRRCSTPSRARPSPA